MDAATHSAFEKLVERLERAVEKRPADAFGRVISVVQLLVLVCTIAGGFMLIGKKDQVLTNLVQHQEKQDQSLGELREITADLANAVASNSTVLAERQDRLRGIELRLRDLESRK